MLAVWDIHRSRGCVLTIINQRTKFTYAFCFYRCAFMRPSLNIRLGRHGRERFVI